MDRGEHDNGLHNDKRYTLQPLMDEGADSLTCLPQDEIKKVTLIEIHIPLHDKFNSTDIIQGNNVFDILQARNRHLTREKGISIRLAKFSVLTVDGGEHTLTIEPPDTLLFDGDFDIMHHWLLKRGFVINKSLAVKKTPRPLNPSLIFLTSATTVSL
jgi:hypothetical protein